MRSRNSNVGTLDPSNVAVVAVIVVIVAVIVVAAAIIIPDILFFSLGQTRVPSAASAVSRRLHNRHSMISSLSS